MFVREEQESEGVSAKVAQAAQVALLARYQETGDRGREESYSS